ncbi:hypothetical protein BDW74DRAFT_94766 [Aspergillus multicolor]|uniref:ATG3/ATG10 family protein n=1 Tax=Aspergillus multicolor TaxID=41759 RepID=UPI003CCD10B3
MTASPGQSALSLFPFLADDEFESGCSALLEHVQATAGPAMPWASIRFQATGQILRICQLLSSECRAIPDDARTRSLDQDSQLENMEEDPEAIIRLTNTQELQVEYDILLSPTYQVPVLYFVIRRAEKLLGIDEVYSHLVPDQFRKKIQSVGIMGGISFGYHPVFGTPAFFVHPCNTAGAMRDISSGEGIGPETYLIIWLGLVGNCVRLQLPASPPG